MNKITYFILLLSFIGYISTSKFCMEMTTKEECISHKVSSLEENLGDDYCCYVEGLTGDYEDENGCDSYDDSEIEESKKEINELGGKIECGSSWFNWLNLGFSLVFLVLYF